jgi:hypothetical protein
LDVQNDLVFRIAIALAAGGRAAYAVEGAIVRQVRELVAGDDPADEVRRGVDPQVEGIGVPRRDAKDVECRPAERRVRGDLDVGWKTLREEPAEAAQIGIAAMQPDGRGVRPDLRFAVAADLPVSRAVEANLRERQRSGE